MSHILIKLATLQPASHRLTPTICRSFASTNTAANKIIDKTENKASPEQLILLENQLVQVLPVFFTKSHPLSLYTKDVIFIDNIRNFRIQGIAMYSAQIALVKIYHYVRYSSLKVELLNLVKNPEESYIRVRWRVVATPGLVNTWLNVGKFNMRAGERWIDGISTLQVNKDGLIYCHVRDNVDIETSDANGSNKQKQSVKIPLHC